MIKKLFNWYCKQTEENDFATLSCQTPIRLLKVSAGFARLNTPVVTVLIISSDEVDVTSELIAVSIGSKSNTIPDHPISTAFTACPDFIPSNAPL